MERLNRKSENHRRYLLALLGFALFGAIGGTAIANNTRNEVLAVATSQLGVREATGHNDGKQVEMYLAVTGLRKGNAWCAAFVSWVFQQAHVKAIRSARVVDWFQKNVVYRKGWQKEVPQLKKAMLAGWYYPELGRYGHIGIIEGWNPGMKDLITIEGNTNGAGSREGEGVYRKIRPMKNIAVIADYIGEN